MKFSDLLMPHEPSFLATFHKSAKAEKGTELPCETSDFREVDHDSLLLTLTAAGAVCNPRSSKDFETRPVVGKRVSGSTVPDSLRVVSERSLG